MPLTTHHSSLIIHHSSFITHHSSLTTHVQNALDAAESHPNILPGSFSAQGFEKDVALFTALTELGTLAASVASQLDDTRLAVGSEAMRETTEVYSYVKATAKTTPGLKPIAEQLGERFKRAHHKKQPNHPSDE